MTGVMPIDLTGVPALTLRNPWAHVIAHGPKRVENRSWMPPEHLTRMLIHAGKAWEKLHRPHKFDGLTASAIVAVADLASACDTSRWTQTLACTCGEWAMPGQCHWRLTNVLALPEPVQCSGRQGLWRPDPPTVAAVAEQLAGAVA